MRNKNGKDRVLGPRWHADPWEAFDYALAFGCPTPPSGANEG